MRQEGRIEEGRVEIEGKIPKISMAAVAAYIYLLFVGFTIFATFDASNLEMTGGGDTMRQASFLGVLIALVSLWSKSPAEKITFPVSLGLAVAWCWLSLIWAIEPEIAFRRVALASIVIAGAYFSIGLVGAAAFRRILATSLAIMIALDVISGFTVANAVHTADALDESIVGAWRGIHSEKNGAGAIAAVTTFVFFFLFLESKRILHVFITCLAVFFLWKTQSKTSFSLLPISLFCGLYFRYGFRNQATQQFTAAVIACLAITASYLVYFNFDAVYDFLFSDPERFTGRTEIWNVMLTYIEENPILGSGYGSFWNIGVNSPSYTHGGWISEFVAVGHNGFLDIFAQIGAAGFCLAMVACIIAPLKHFLSKYDLQWRIDNAPWVAVVVFSAIHNFQESSFLERDNALWVSLLFAIFLSRSLKPTKSPNAQPLLHVTTTPMKPSIGRLTDLPNKFRRSVRRE